MFPYTIVFKHAVNGDVYRFNTDEKGLLYLASLIKSNFYVVNNDNKFVNQDEFGVDIGFWQCPPV